MTQPVAVLVDGDNISGKNAAAILGIAMKHGDPVVVRAYLDAQRASDWHGAIGYRLVHAGSGKNASDILLAIDACYSGTLDDKVVMKDSSSLDDFSRPGENDENRNRTTH